MTRQRSRSPLSRRSDRDKDNRRRSTSRSVSPQRSIINLVAEHIAEISEESYFERSREFVLWLRKRKGKIYSQLDGSEARRYFRTFVRKWNAGKLSFDYYRYDPLFDRQTYKGDKSSKSWTFASNVGVQRELEAARLEVLRSTEKSTEQGPPQDSVRKFGPTRPNQHDQQYAAESMQDISRAKDAVRAKRLREEAEELVPLDKLGRESRLAEKRATNELDKASMEHRTSGDAPEISDSILLGAGDNDSFKAMVTRRDAARMRSDNKRGVPQRTAEMNDRLSQRQQKEAETMAMLASLAQSRFGTS